MVELASPPGYSSVSTLSQEVVNKQQDASLITKRSWDIAVAPLKQVHFDLLTFSNCLSLFPRKLSFLLLNFVFWCKLSNAYYDTNI